MYCLRTKIYFDVISGILKNINDQKGGAPKIEILELASEVRRQKVLFVLSSPKTPDYDTSLNWTTVS
jgi:hypothetical protein